MLMSNFNKRLSNSVFGKSLSLLSTQDKQKLFLVGGIQIVMSLFDLLGVIAIGALGALAVQGVESHQPGNRVSVFLNLLGIKNQSFQNQITIIGLLAGGILVTKSILSMYFTRKTLYFLSYKSAQISAKLISGVLNQNLLQIQRRTNQEILFIITDGVRIIMVGILGSISAMASDIALLCVMFFGLFAVNPYLSFSTLLIFSFVAFLLHRLLRTRATIIGKTINTLQIKSNEKILEVLNSYRESVVRNRRFYYSEEIRNMRYDMGGVLAEMNFQPFISKYIIELTVVIGSLGLAGYEFGITNAVHAISTLTIFMAASSRITPAILRVQQNLLTIRQSTGAVDATFELINEIGIKMEISEVASSSPATFNYIDFSPHIEIKSLYFNYPSDSSFQIQNLSLIIDSGQSVAFVGPSGAGKTTIIDLILGVLEPATGEVMISGVTPMDAAREWPGAISYVPQNIFISSGTVRENVGLGFPIEVASDERVWSALKAADLLSVVSDLPRKLDTPLGEHGGRISGGQRQRMGIARALFTSPKILVLDEATSALDAQSEEAIRNSIQKLSGDVTVLIVAHRLSTVRSADLVVYIDQGKIIAKGTFAEVRRAVPNFDTQAVLMGL